MPFVHEKFPDSEKAKIENLIAARPKFSRPVSSSWWTVDRDNGLALILVGKEGGTYEGTPETQHYVLESGYGITKFSGAYHLSGSLALGQPQIMVWNVSKIEFPTKDSVSQQTITALIREALDAQGWLNDRACLSAVTVSFDLNEKN